MSKYEQKFTDFLLNLKLTYNPHTAPVLLSVHTHIHMNMHTHGSAICGLSLVVVRQHDEVCRD